MIKLASVLSTLGLTFVIGFVFFFYPFWLSVIIFAGLIILLELFFRIGYRLKTGASYVLIPKVPFDQIHVEPHPYLPFVYKKRFLCQRGMDVPFLLHKKKYRWGEYTTNNLRHLNGPKGDRDVLMPKPKDLIRVNCLGASTTAYYVEYKGDVYTYPLILEKNLQQEFPDLDIEVNNFGMGGWSSAETLINFTLRIIDTQPDVVVIYHGYNDLRMALAPDYENDYSHARQNLGEVYHLYRMASWVPYMPLAFYNYLVRKLIFSQNIQSSLLEATTPGWQKAQKFDADYRAGLHTFQRNLEHIIHICKSNGISVVLSTFCHYLYDDIKHDSYHSRFHHGIEYANLLIQQLAEKHDIECVDNARKVPYENENFIDSIHFSHAGMRIFADNVSPPIIDHIRKHNLG